MQNSLRSVQRNSGLDLLRIIACMMVFTCHFLSNGILFNVEFGSFNTIAARGIEAVSIVCINIFILVSGYFGIKSKGINTRRKINMLIMVAFFSVISYVYYAFRKNNFSISGLLTSFAPYFVGGYWFIRVYLILVLISPFLNLCLSKLNSKAYLYLVIICYILFSVLPSFCKAFKNSDGYDIIHFAFIYSVGGYIRLHLSKKPNVFLSIVFFGLFAIATCAFSIWGDGLGYWAYDFITVIPESVFLFLAFEQFQFSSKFISFIAQSSLAVFVLENCIGGLYNDILKVKDFMETPLFIPHYLICVIGFSVFALSVDCLRRIVFKYSIDKILDKIPIINKRILDNLE